MESNEASASAWFESVWSREIHEAVLQVLWVSEIRFKEVTTC